MTTVAGGFGPAALHFFDALEEDNSREFWLAHVDEFEREVKAPMTALLESLPAEYQSFRMFRMNRDLRFSKDKSPYKLQHSGVLSAGGIDHYVHLDAGGLLAACGIYWMQRDQLERYRAAVDDGRRGKALMRILADLGPADPGSTMGVDALKTAPRGYPRDHPRIDLLRQKGVVAHRTLSGPELADGVRVRQFVLEVFESAKPLNAWLKRHVGPTSESNEPGS
ncbi:MAG TPA: DUF2461 domain-containing protein [Propionibacteriaceae bacterium]